MGRLEWVGVDGSREGSDRGKGRGERWGNDAGVHDTASIRLVRERSANKTAVKQNER